VFKLLYLFPTPEEAEGHAACFRIVMKVSLCGEQGESNTIDGFDED
jgi:hypothetical protein